MPWSRCGPAVGLLLVLLVGVQVGVHVGYHIDPVRLRSLRVLPDHMRLRVAPIHHASPSLRRAGGLEPERDGRDGAVVEPPASAQEGAEAQADYAEPARQEDAAVGQGPATESEQEERLGGQSERGVAERLGSMPEVDDSGVEREAGGWSGGGVEEEATATTEADVRAKAGDERRKKHHPVRALPAGMLPEDTAWASRLGSLSDTLLRPLGSPADAASAKLEVMWVMPWAVATTLRARSSAVRTPAAAAAAASSEHEVDDSTLGAASRVEVRGFEFLYHCTQAKCDGCLRFTALQLRS
jgi:hypothetical protein